MKKFICLLTYLFALFGCKKNNTPPEPDPPYYQFSAEGLSYIQLPVNSYFIYKDSAIGIEDSVVVVKSALDKTYAPAQGGLFSGNLAYYFQVFTLQLKSSLTTDFWFSGSASSSSSEIFALNSNYNGLKYSVFIYPVVSRFISSMEVQGNLYFNVERYEFDSPSPAISVIYYWAKGVGIIKRQVKTSGTIKTELLTRRG